MEHKCREIITSISRQIRKTRREPWRRIKKKIRKLLGGGGGDRALSLALRIMPDTKYILKNTCQRNEGI